MNGVNGRKDDDAMMMCSSCVLYYCTYVQKLRWQYYTSIPTYWYVLYVRIIVQYCTVLYETSYKREENSSHDEIHWLSLAINQSSSINHQFGRTTLFLFHWLAELIISHFEVIITIQIYTALYFELTKLSFLHWIELISK